MNILYIGMDNTLYEGRSLEVRVADIMAQQGNFVHLVTERLPKYGEDEKPENMANYVMPVNRGLNDKQMAMLLSLDYDAIFASSISGVSIITYLGAKKKLPTICQVLDIPVWRLKYKHWTEEWKPRFEAAIQCSKLIANHSIAQNVLQQTLDDKCPPVEIIYYGIDGHTADSVGYPPQEKATLIVSRQVWYKGIDQLIYAMVGVEDLELRIVGSGNDNFRLYETACMAAIKARFYGAISDTQKFLEIKKSMFGVYPNICKFIGGLFPLESLYCEKPCIVYDLPVSREIYLDHVEYVKPYDINALRQKMRWLAENPSYCKKRGKEGKKFVSEHRTFEHQTLQLLRVMEESL